MAKVHIVGRRDIYNYPFYLGVMVTFTSRVLLITLSLLWSGFSWGANAAFVISGDTYLGCLYKTNDRFDTFNAQVSKKDCKKIYSADLKLIGRPAKKMEQNPNYLSINGYDLFKDIDHRIHQELKGTVKKLRTLNHKNSDHGNNHLNSYYGYIYFKFIENIYINLTPLVKTYKGYHPDNDYLDEDFVSQEMIDFLDAQRMRFEGPNKSRMIKIKMVSHDEKENNALVLHQDHTDYLCTYITSADVEGGDLEIYASPMSVGGLKDNYGRPIAQAYSLEFSKLLTSHKCVEGVGYLIREGSSSQAPTFPATTHKHTPWKEMKERDLIIFRFFDMAGGLIY